MLKIEKEYEKNYGHIPQEVSKRLEYLLETMNYRNKKESVLDKMIEISRKKWKTQSFTIYLVPEATPRARYTSKGSFFYVKGAKNNKTYFQKFMQDISWEVIYTPCKLYVDSYFPIPSSMSKPEKILAELGFIRPISKPDWDNVGKTYSDMIQGILLYDDSLIIEGTSRKFYSVKPRIEIMLKYLEEFDSPYNEKKMKKKIGKVGTP